MEYRYPGKLQITLLRYDIHIVAGLFVLQYIPDYLALTFDPITKKMIQFAKGDPMKVLIATAVVAATVL